MAIEIERKFLVTSEDWKPLVVARKRLRQAYLARPGKTSIRVRIVDDTSASLTIKSQSARTSRLEFEYPIPVNDGLFLLDMREGHLLSKVRHMVRYRWLDVGGRCLRGRERRARHRRDRVGSRAAEFRAAALGRPGGHARAALFQLPPGAAILSELCCRGHARRRALIRRRYAHRSGQSPNSTSPDSVSRNATRSACSSGVSRSGRTRRWPGIPCRRSSLTSE